MRSSRQALHSDDSRAGANRRKGEGAEREKVKWSIVRSAVRGECKVCSVSWISCRAQIATGSQWGPLSVPHTSRVIIQLVVEYLTSISSLYALSFTSSEDLQWPLDLHVTWYLVVLCDWNMVTVATKATDNLIISPFPGLISHSIKVTTTVWNK